MHASLSRLLVVVVVALAAVPRTLAAAPPANLPTFPSVPVWPDIMPASALSGGSRPSSLTYLDHVDDYPDALSDDTDSRIRKSILDDFTLRMLEAQQMYQQDRMMMHHLMQEQDYRLQGPYRYTPWPLPIFFPPFLPERGDGVGQHAAKKPIKTDKNSQSNEKSSEQYPEGLQSAEEDSVELEYEDEPGDVFLDSPTPGPEWHIIPFLPPVPDADDLPDTYHNSTSTIHIVNGSIVEINSTTLKDTTDNITTFLHTEVINILSDESKENSSEEERGESTERTLTREEVTTREPHPTEGTTDEEKTKVESPEQPTLEGETKKTFSEPGPSVHAVSVKPVDPEVGGGGEFRPARGAVTDEPTTPKPPTTPATRPEAQRSAAYVKRPDSGTGKKGKEVEGPPRDLSGDTLVNNLAGDAKTGMPADPDAEIIHEEFI